MVGISLVKVLNLDKAGEVMGIVQNNVHISKDFVALLDLFCSVWNDLLNEINILIFSYLVFILMIRLPWSFNSDI